MNSIISQKDFLEKVFKPYSKKKPIKKKESQLFVKSTTKKNKK